MHLLKEQETCMLFSKLKLFDTTIDIQAENVISKLGNISLIVPNLFLTSINLYNNMSNPYKIIKYVGNL